MLFVLAIACREPEFCADDDRDCDGTADWIDNDGDGLTEESGDCLDNADAVHPGAEEVLDGLDNDCDGVVDDPGVFSGEVGCSGEYHNASSVTFVGGYPPLSISVANTAPPAITGLFSDEFPLEGTMWGSTGEATFWMDRGMNGVDGVVDFTRVNPAKIEVYLLAEGGASVLECAGWVTRVDEGS